MTNTGSWSEDIKARTERPIATMELDTIRKYRGIRKYLLKDEIDESAHMAMQ